MNSVPRLWRAVQLTDDSSIALTCDGWSRDLYLTVTAYHRVEGKMQQKVLITKTVYKVQTCCVVAERNK